MPIKPDDNPLPIDELQRRSVPGMAYFAGTSVRRTFCDNCAFFTFGKRLWRWKDVDAHLQQAAEDAVDDAAVVRITQAVRRLRGKT
jgi:hypothetical protein